MVKLLKGTKLQYHIIWELSEVQKNGKTWYEAFNRLHGTLKADTEQALREKVENFGKHQEGN